MNLIKRKLMAFGDIFKDSNDLNEKNIVGFISFVVMIIFAVVDILSGVFGEGLNVNDFIYNSFVFVTLGSFGISEIGKFVKNKTPEPDSNENFRRRYQGVTRGENYDDDRL